MLAGHNEPLKLIIAAIQSVWELSANIAIQVNVLEAVAACVGSAADETAIGEYFVQISFL